MGGGGGGRDTRTFENRGVRPPINLDISVPIFFIETYKILHFPNIFKI